MLINLASQYAPWLPDRLFANGQQGVWYVPQPVYRGGQVLFQDAAGTTPVTADGDPVGLMLDLSPNGNDASQSTSAARPLYRTDGTLHWLEFDGVDDHFEYASTITGDASRTHVFSARDDQNPGTADNAIVGLGDTDASGNGWFLAPTHLNETFYVRLNGAYTVTVPGYPQTAVASARWDNTQSGVASDANIRINAVNYSSSSGAVNVNTTAGARISGRPDNSWMFLGRLYGFAEVVEFISESQNAKLENYLANLAGITL